MRPDRRKLTAEQVIEARAMWRDGATATAVGVRYGLAWEPMQQALTGMTYKEVPDPITEAEVRFRRSHSQREARA